MHKPRSAVVEPIGPLRKIIRSVGGGSWNRRFVTVRASTIVYGASEAKQEKMIPMEKVVSAQALSRSEVATKGAPEKYAEYGWALRTDERETMWVCECAADRDEWVRYVSNVVAARDPAKRVLPTENVAASVDRFQVEVFIAQGRNLVVCDLKSSDPMVVVSCGISEPCEKRTTKTISSNLNPIFNERFTFYFTGTPEKGEGEATLAGAPTFVRFDVFDANLLQNAKPMGSVRFALQPEHFMADHATAVPAQFYSLSLPGRANAGELQVEVLCRRIASHSKGSPTAPSGLSLSCRPLGMVKVTVVECCEIQSYDAPTYIEVSHGTSYSRTSTKPIAAGTKGCVVWNEDVRFWIREDTKNYQLSIRAFCDDAKTKAQDGRVLSHTIIALPKLLGEHLSACSMCGWVAMDRSGSTAVTDKEQTRAQQASVVLLDSPDKVNLQMQHALKVEIAYTPRDILENHLVDELWEQFDTDRSGTLNRTEVAAMLDTLNIGSGAVKVDELVQDDTSSAMVSNFVQLLDANNDGQIDKAEFAKLLNSAEFQTSPLSYTLLAFVLDGKEALSRMVYGRTSSVRAALGSGGQTIAAVDSGGSNITDDMGLTIFDRHTGLLLHEHIPNFVKVALKAMYRGGFGRKVAETAALKKMLVAQSRSEGLKMDKPESREKIAPFIAEHSLDPATFLDRVEDYPHFNAFFYRKLKPGLRPITAPDDDTVVVSPADSRMTVFATLFDALVVWIKGSAFSIENLLGPRAADLAGAFTGASLIIARLAPQDYHRFHAPVSGQIRSITRIDGTLFTVNPIAVKKEVNVYTENIRVIVEIETKTFGTVLMIPVGATMVGSIVFDPEIAVGARIQKGQDMGCFAFGGSTTLLLFQRGRITLDADLLEKSAIPLEVLIRVGDRIAVAA